VAQYIYSMVRARKAHGDKVILDDVTLAFLPGAKIGVVGPNGAGKSTVLQIMAGMQQPSNGDVMLAPDATVGILLQEPPLNEALDVRGNVEEAVKPLRDALVRFEEVSAAMGEPDADFDSLLAEQGELMEVIEQHDGWELDARIEQAMDALRCPPGDADVTVLSGGERRRVALCRLLLEAPDLLLLDEPTNHLDAESVAWLEQHLEKYAGTVVAVTHDRYFLDNVAQWILELDRGRAYPYEGNYSTYLETKATRLTVEGAKDAKRAKRLKDELEWVRSGAKARQAKSKARLARYEEMAAEAEKTRKLDFEEIQIPPGPRLGNVVVETQDLTKGFGDRLLIDDLSFTLPRNGIVGVVGPNGAGKTTLFKMLVGEEKPDDGEIKVGETVKVSYVEQNRSGIDPKKTLWDVVSDGLDHIKVGNVEMPSRAYVAAFGFKGPDQQKPAGVLSGGERNRLNLALTLKQGGNLLLLDEPTNDLDVETLTSLEGALLDFPGCAVVVSHDRWFLDRVATHILAYEGNSKWFWFEGNFQDYEKYKVERLGPDLPQAQPRLSRPGLSTHTSSDGRSGSTSAGRSASADASREPVDEVDLRPGLDGVRAVAGADERHGLLLREPVEHRQAGEGGPRPSRAAAAGDLRPFLACPREELEQRLAEQDGVRGEGEVAPPHPAALPRQRRRRPRQEVEPQVRLGPRDVGPGPAADGATRRKGEHSRGVGGPGSSHLSTVGVPASDGSVAGRRAGWTP
jgi:ATP-binding cassette ChvD family protein